jgi:hypothetical protein
VATFDRPRPRGKRSRGRDKGRLKLVEDSSKNLADADDGVLDWKVLILSWNIEEHRPKEIDLGNSGRCYRPLYVSLFDLPKPSRDSRARVPKQRFIVLYAP